VKRTGVVAAAYIAITLIVVSPLIDYRHLSTASYEGDARLLIWTLAWDAHALWTGTPLFEANIFYPEPQSLRYAEHHVGAAIFATPLYAATGNPILTYWILWLLAFPLNALAMYVLARRVTGDDLAAFTAGCIYAFCFFRMHHAHGHIQLMWTWAMPLVPLALDRWIVKPTPAAAALLTGAILLTAVTSWYLAVFVALLVLVSLACLLPGRAITVAHVWQGGLASIIGIVAVARLARPYFGLVAGPATEAAANAADLRSYALPPANTWLGQVLLR